MNVPQQLETFITNYCLGKKTNDTNAIIFTSDINHNIISLHSLVKFGGTLLRPTTKIGCLIRNGRNATAVVVHANTATENCNIATPTINAIIAYNTIATINNLPNPAATAAITFPGCVTFLPAPWLVKAVLKEKSSDPFSLILTTKIQATAFDTAREVNADFITKTSDHLGDFVLWAWGVK